MLELPHRQHARIEQRIRAAKATELGILPFERLRRNVDLLECASEGTGSLLIVAAIAWAASKAFSCARLALLDDPTCCKG